ncbi:MAG: MaoC family dehydratase N-terminal domain-containing protein [Candidatus Tectomicrobia bacterium]|nr:MaoC family dehydratase N-terminal domain-containing protein [Candidatus Tectomicrobia bacterium]
MAQESVITEEMRHLIGAETPPHTFEVEKGALRKFLNATGDTNPLFRDEEWARKTEYGGIIAPPTFFCPDALIAGQVTGLKRVPNPFRYSIDGGSEWESFQPVRVGDTLSITTKIADIYEKQGSARTGRMLFTIVEATCRNQRGELVGICRGVSISYEGPKQ